MFRLLPITPNQQVADEVAALAGQTVSVRTVPPLNSCKVNELERALRTHSPDLAVLDLEHLEQPGRVLGAIRSASPDIGVIGLCREAGPWSLEFQPDALLRELAPTPDQLEQSVRSALRAHLGASALFAFLPAKAGSGSSTAALHTAYAFSAKLGRSTLLLEADQRAGTYSILLNTRSKLGMKEALTNAANLNDGEWSRYRVSALGVDVLLGHPQKEYEPHTWADYLRLLMFVQRQYEVIVADLPELVNSASVEVARSAHAVFVVCTPELPSLAMASVRISNLVREGVDPSRIHCVVNRWQEGQVTRSAAEAAMGRPVYATLANSYLDVQDSILMSRALPSRSPLSQDCETLARRAATLAAFPEKAATDAECLGEAAKMDPCPPQLQPLRTR